MICPEPCGKTRYSDRYRALLACIGVVMDGGPPMVPYRAVPCGCWHLTAHKKDKPRTGALIKKVDAFRASEEEDQSEPVRGQESQEGSG